MVPGVLLLSEYDGAAQELANALFVNPCASQEHRRNVQEMPRVLGAWMCFESSRSSRKRFLLLQLCYEGGTTRTPWRTP